MPTLGELIDTLPQQGVVRWIGVRHGRNADVRVLEHVEARAEHGLAGDHCGNRGGKRQATLIQAAVASMLGIATVDPASVRRNLVVSGINLLALKDRQSSIGGATFAFTGLCHRCSRMEVALGPGGYNALRGHGGITARIVRGGTMRVGDAVSIA